jgi:hypothetical protein
MRAPWRAGIWDLTEFCTVRFQLWMSPVGDNAHRRAQRYNAGTAAGVDRPGRYAAG